jgi:hypothetical protein
VDGFSSGVFLAPAFRERGIPCIHLLSHDVFPEGIRSLKAAADLNTESSRYVKTLVFDGDYDATIRALSDYTVIGVIPGMELDVPLADALGERMGLVSNGTRHSPARRDKYLMQCALRTAGLPTKRFLRAKDGQEILRWALAEGIGEVVIKPVNSAGTDGVRFCSSDEEILQAFGALIGKNNLYCGEENTEVLAEERLTGTEYGVNTVSWDGKHRLAELWQYRKVRVEGAGNVYDCTRLQAWPDESLLPLVRYAFGALDALGIRYGAAHTEIMLTERGPLLIESGARIMGGKIPPDLITRCAGQCQVGLMALAYSDPEIFLAEIDLPYHRSSHLVRKHLISGSEGLCADDIAAIDMIAELESCSRGDFIHLIDEWYIHPTVDMDTSPATVFLVHDDPGVIRADYLAIRDYEKNHEQELYNLCSLLPGGSGA